MTNAPEGASPPPAKSTSRLGARAVLAAVALALVAVSGALTLLLVEDKWPPLLRADVGTSQRLNGYAVAHPGFVRAMQLISDSGSARAWLVVFSVVVVWLLWRRLPRLALFVVITAAGSSLLNTVVKSAVHRLRVHYVSDVVGGLVLGAAWVAAMAAAFNAMRVDRGHRSVDAGEGLEPEQAPRLAGNTRGDEELDHSQ